MLPFANKSSLGGFVDFRPFCVSIFHFIRLCILELWLLKLQKKRCETAPISLYKKCMCANVTNPHDSQFNMKTDRNCLPPSSANHILKSKLKPRWSRALGYSIQSSEAQLEASSVSSVSAVASSLLLFASFSSLFHDVGCADAPLKTKTFIQSPRIIRLYSVNHCYSKCWNRSWVSEEAKNIFASTALRLGPLQRLCQSWQTDLGTELEVPTGAFSEFNAHSGPGAPSNLSKTCAQSNDSERAATFTTALNIFQTSKLHLSHQGRKRFTRNRHVPKSIRQFRQLSTKHSISWSNSLHALSDELCNTKSFCNTCQESEWPSNTPPRPDEFCLSNQLSQL